VRQILDKNPRGPKKGATCGQRQKCVIFPTLAEDIRSALLVKHFPNSISTKVRPFWSSQKKNLNLIFLEKNYIFRHFFS